MTRIFARLLAASALAGACLAVPAVAKSVHHHAKAATRPAAASLAAAPGWGAFGVQTRYMDAAVKPGDDFFRFVNGKWLDSTEIPADRTSFGSFIALRDLSETRMHTILDELSATPQAPGSAGARVAAAYKAFMDTDAIERAGMTPAQPMLARIAAAKNAADLTMLFTDPSLASPISLGVGPDGKDSNANVLNAGQASLGLADRDYYLVDSPRNLEIRTKYKAYLTTVLGAAGYADAPASADAVIALETKMAAANWDRAMGRNRTLTYNKIGIDEFAAFAPDVPLKAALASMGVGAANTIVVRQVPPTAEELAAEKYTPAMAAKLGGGVPALARLISSEPVSSWQAWLAARFISSKASVLPKAIDDANFAFYGTELNGQPQQRPRWKRALGSVEGSVGELVGQIYAQRYFPAQNKAAMEQLVGNLRKAMALNLGDLKWMSADTRKEAVAKLDAFNPKIGYPGQYKTYDGLTLTPDSAFANSLANDAWQQHDNIRRLGQPVDKTEWGMLPETVNAYYNPSFNEIVFPAAILQPPFFNLTADPAVNYGAIGAVIGHEMGHGFDDQGAKSDGAGNLRNWWTDADKGAFDKLTGALAAQYDAFCPFDASTKTGKACINGRLTLGENIGDLGGLSLAYRAYHMSLNGKPARVIGGYTGDQRFFMAWAQIYREKVRENAERQQLQTDPHSPGQYRANGIVRNFDEWYKAFGVKPGDKLYLPPEQRIRIW